MKIRGRFCPSRIRVSLPSNFKAGDRVSIVRCFFFGLVLFLAFFFFLLLRLIVMEAGKNLALVRLVLLPLL